VIHASRIVQARLSATDQFLIPAGNTYSLTNLSATDSIKLHCVIIKPIFVQSSVSRSASPGQINDPPPLLKSNDAASSSTSRAHPLAAEGGINMRTAATVLVPRLVHRDEPPAADLLAPSEVSNPEGVGGASCVAGGPWQEAEVAHLQSLADNEGDEECAKDENQHTISRKRGRRSTQDDSRVAQKPHNEPIADSHTSGHNPSEHDVINEEASCLETSSDKESEEENLQQKGQGQEEKTRSCKRQRIVSQ
jgi:hypothetical protein